MKDRILKWWNRTWSNWVEDGVIVVYMYEGDKIPAYRKQRLKRVSNDGLVEYKLIKKG